MILHESNYKVDFSVLQFIERVIWYIEGQIQIQISNSK